MATASYEQFESLETFESSKTVTKSKKKRIPKKRASPKRTTADLDKDSPGGTKIIDHSEELDPYRSLDQSSLEDAEISKSPLILGPSPFGQKVVAIFPNCT